MENTPDSQNVPKTASSGEPGDQEGADDAAALLTPGQEAAIAALVGEPTYAKAAKAAGVGERTLRRWMHNDAAFRRRLREARTAVFENAIRTLHGASSDASGILEGIARNEKSPQGVRVAAARALLHYSCRGREIAEMDDRMSALEERLEQFNAFLKEKASWRSM